MEVVRAVHRERALVEDGIEAARGQRSNLPCFTRAKLAARREPRALNARWTATC
jgi:hypothetical protein